MKLSSPFDKFNMTQDGHGATSVSGIPTNGMAYDFSASSKQIAPCDCRVVYKKSKGEHSEYMVELGDKDNSRMYVLHALPDRLGAFKRGEVICSKPVSIPGGLPDHYHSLIHHKGRSYRLHDFVDRNTPLYWYGKNKSPHTDWSHYADLHLNLPITEPIEVPRKMQSYKVDLDLVTNNTIKMELRKAPNKASDDLGDVPPESSLKASELVQDSELVSGVSTWYRVTVGAVQGYISGAFVGEVKQVTFDEEKKKYEDQISALETKLLETNQEVTRLVELVEPLQNSINEQTAQIETLTTKIDNQSKELTKFNEFKRSVFYALFLIFNRKR